MDLEPILKKTGARHKIHIGSLISRLETSNQLRSNNKSEVKIVRRNKDQFILHFKSATFHNKPISNGLFLATFANSKLQKLEVLGVTRRFSSQAAYFVHYNTLFIFYFHAQRRTTANERGSIGGHSQSSHAIRD